MYSLSSRDYFFLIFKEYYQKGTTRLHCLSFLYWRHLLFDGKKLSVSSRYNLLLDTLVTFYLLFDGKKLSVSSRYNLLSDTLVTFIKETRVNALMRGSYWNPYGCTHPGEDCRDISDKRLASNNLDAIFDVIGESALLSLGMFNKKFRICLKPISYYEKVSKFRISKKNNKFCRSSQI